MSIDLTQLFIKNAFNMQVVWKDSSELGMGCTKSPTKNEVYVVALYNPPGNIPSKLRSNVLDPTGKSSDDLYGSIAKRFDTIKGKKNTS